tara:strand:- start:561 stop:1004 length:444 start_codon:yes stop_codon:yes gene_type:complete
MKKIKLFGLFVLAGLLFISCSSDDEGGGVIDDNINANELLGTWLLVEENINGEVESIDDDECSFIIDFTSDIFTSTEYFGPDCLSEESFSAPYNVSGNTLVLSVEGDTEEVEILTLSSEVLQVRYEDVYTEDGQEITDITIETYSKQ